MSHEPSRLATRRAYQALITCGSIMSDLLITPVLTFHKLPPIVKITFRKSGLPIIKQMDLRFYFTAFTNMISTKFDTAV